VKKSGTINFEFVPEYLSCLRKSAVESLLTRNATDFIPTLSVWYNTPTADKQSEKYVQPEDSLMLVCLDDNLIGMCHFQLDSLIGVSKGLQKNLHILATMIDKPFRGNGLATILHEEIEHLNTTILHRPYIFRSTWGTKDSQREYFHSRGYSLLPSSIDISASEVQSVLYGKQIS
jgi:hypothetical protein